MMNIIKQEIRNANIMVVEEFKREMITELIDAVKKFGIELDVRFIDFDVYPTEDNKMIIELVFRGMYLNHAEVSRTASCFSKIIMDYGFDTWGFNYC